MKKILIILLVLLFVFPVPVYSFEWKGFNWNKVEEVSYSILEFAYIGTVGFDVGTTLSVHRQYVKETNPIARPVIERGEGLFVAGSMAYCGGVTFGLRKIREAENKEVMKMGKVTSWILLVFLIGAHSLAIENNLGNR